MPVNNILEIVAFIVLAVFLNMILDIILLHQESRRNARDCKE